MKGFFKKILLTFSLLSIIVIQVGADTLTPPNIKLLGDSSGLVHIPGDELFLYYPNMVPGDSINRTIEIKNNNEYPYELFMRAERVTPNEEYDLLNKLELKISYKDKIIYDGPTSGEDKLKGNISLGIFKPGDEENIVAEVKLDGPSTGNEYKNKSAQVDWIFTAVRNDGTSNPSNNSSINNNSGKQPPKKNVTSLPSTGDNSVINYTLIGALSVLLGLIVIKIKNKECE